jgi:transcriptional regulator NrdR family protein
MKEKPRMTLAEMAAKSAQTNGRLICPKCGCSHFDAGKRRQSGNSIARYRKCRNCGTSALTWQGEEKIIRIVGEEEDVEDDSNLL